MPLRIAFLVTDNREAERRYDLPTPFFGTAPTALLEGFSLLAKPEGGNLTPESENDVSPQLSGLRSQTSNLEIHIISCTQRPVEAPQKLAANVWFHSLVVPKWGWLRSGYFGCVLAVRRKLLELQPDIVHAQGTERECAMSAAFSSFPKVLTLHGNLRKIRREVGFRPLSAMWCQSLLEGPVIPRFDGVVCISEYTRGALRGEARKTWIVPNAAGSEFFTRPGNFDQFSSSPHVASKEAPIFLVVGTVERRKNQIALIRALDPLSAEKPLSLHFIGCCGDTDPYCRKFLRLIAKRNWCHFAGSVGRAELRKRLDVAYALILPSLEENCPMVILEAQAAGVPVAASSVGGIPELITHGETGLLFDPHNSGSIREAVTRLLHDFSLAAQIARNAANRALTKFLPPAVAHRHIEIYKEVLGENK